jgi:hypothetical protein
MRRSARLQAARRWLETFDGKNVIRGYAKWFAVDLGCALKELPMLGVKLDPVYVERLKVTLENRNKPPKAPTSAEDEDIDNGYGIDWDDDFAYIAGWTSGGRAGYFAHPRKTAAFTLPSDNPSGVHQARI